MKPIKKRPLEDAMDDRKEKKSSSSGGTPGWMRTGDDIAKEIKRNKAEQASNMVPSFWLQDGETKQVRFLSDKPIASIYRYSMQVRGKWRKFTQPAPGEVDLFSKAGKDPFLVCIYEIIDVTGYLDKNKKRVRKTRKFWEVGSRIESSLKKIREKFGGLTKRNLEVSREGEGTKAAYTFIPEDKSPMPTPREPEALTPQFTKFFAPPTMERQARILGIDPDRVDADDGDDSDDE